MAWRLSCKVISYTVDSHQPRLRPGVESVRVLQTLSDASVKLFRDAFKSAAAHQSIESQAQAQVDGCPQYTSCVTLQLKGQAMDRH